MNREIEFRCWNANHFKMYYNVGLSMIGVQVYENDLVPENILHNFGRETVHIMQFTGLLDKNGVKIFEGHELNNKYVVVYESPSYVLINILSGDISQFYENESTYEITREYAQMEKD